MFEGYVWYQDNDSLVRVFEILFGISERLALRHEVTRLEG